MNMLLASCSTHSILVDIKNPEKPFRINAIMDTNNFQGRHTAAFSNDAKKLIQTEEWGGGGDYWNGGQAETLADLLKKDTAKWAPIVKTIGFTAEA